MEFHCKEFSLNHSKSSMKIGTDAILLSCLSPKAFPENMIDIGTGCGIISLCMAQKYSKAKIIAIDIDKNSVLEASENFRNSKYFERLVAKEISLEDFVLTNNQKFDLIISNPPFFISSLESPKENRNNARHNISLSYNELISYSRRIISPNGILSIILPFKESKIFEHSANDEGFEVVFRTKIFSKPNKVCERVVLHLKLKESIIKEDFQFVLIEKEIILRDEQNNYTEDYKNLVKEFLL